MLNEMPVMVEREGGGMSAGMPAPLLLILVVLAGLLVLAIVLAIKRGVALYLLGWLLLLGGAGLAGYGIYSKNKISDSYYGFGVYRKDEINNAETYILIGIVLAFIGLFVLIARYIAGKKSGAASVNPVSGIAYVPVGTIMSDGTCCSNCGALLPAGNTFCGKCGVSLIHREINTEKLCVTCGEALTAGSLFCTKCGTKVAAKEPESILQCGNCGAEMQEGMLFCCKCGTKVENEVS